MQENKNLHFFQTHIVIKKLCIGIHNRKLIASELIRDIHVYSGGKILVEKVIFRKISLSLLIEYI